MIHTHVMDCRGLKVHPFAASSMELAVEPGKLIFSDLSVVEFVESTRLRVRPPGMKRFSHQVYTIQGVGKSSPCGWNGEGIRGSGGVPYQRMVPGTLQVWNEDRSILYLPGQDYVKDYYWGTIKRHPDGGIPEGAKLSLDYDVWLCRYDAVVIDSRRRELRIVEGDTEALESRELLLPEPPLVADGYVLAHVFLSWGQTQIHSGGSYVRRPELDAGMLFPCTPELDGTYMDMVPRTYRIELISVISDEQFLLRMGASGEDYGTGQLLNLDSLRWTEPISCDKHSKIPLVLVSAYGNLVEWGLEIDFSQIDLQQLKENQIFDVVAVPQMIFDLRNHGRDPLDLVPLERFHILQPIKDKLASGKPVRIAFYGESTTRNGRWPYQLMDGLRQLYPRSICKSSNVAVSGENSLVGVRRIQNEVLNLKPDLVLIEYLLNDTSTGKRTEVEQTLRFILEQIQSIGALCLIVTGNGMNPLFSPHGSFRNFRAFYELYRQLAAEYNCAFVGGYHYFTRLQQVGMYFLTELKGNMINHPYGNVDPHWGSFDRVISDSILSGFAAASPEPEEQDAKSD